MTTFGFPVGLRPALGLEHCWSFGWTALVGWWGYLGYLKALQLLSRLGYCAVEAGDWWSGSWCWGDKSRFKRKVPAKNTFPLIFWNQKVKTWRSKFRIIKTFLVIGLSTVKLVTISTYGTNDLCFFLSIKKTKQKNITIIKFIITLTNLCVTSRCRESCRCEQMRTDHLTPWSAAVCRHPSPLHGPTGNMYRGNG